MKRQSPIKLKVSAALITGAVRLWFGSVRTRVLRPDIYDAYFKDSATGSVVAGAWHRNAVFLFYFFRNLGPRGVMISRSKDGDLTAKIGECLGYTPIRGSSSRGGADALRAMVDFLADTSGKRLCGTPVDGPKGPARQMKTGMLALAKQSGAWFIPMACSGTRLLTLSKAWDQTILPKPFSKVLIDFGNPVRVPPDISDADFEALRVKMEAELNRLTDKLDRICGYKKN